MSTDPARAQLRERLLEMLAEMELWADDPTAAYERVAEQFYTETGFLALGKSVPLEMSTVGYDEERRRRYDAWHLQRRELRHNTMREAISRLGEPEAPAVKEGDKYCMFRDPSLQRLAQEVIGAIEVSDAALLKAGIRWMRRAEAAEAALLPADAPADRAAWLTSHVDRGHSIIKRESYDECSCGATFHWTPAESPVSAREPEDQS